MQVLSCVLREDLAIPDLCENLLRSCSSEPLSHRTSCIPLISSRAENELSTAVIVEVNSVEQEGLRSSGIGIQRLERAARCYKARQM